jgi:alpha-glucosidase
MQWTDGPAAGFTIGTPWLPVAEAAKTHNVEKELADPKSILNLYRQLLKLRKNETALREGRYTELNSDDPNVLAYLREDDGQKESVLIALNMSDQSCTVRFDLGRGNLESLLSGGGGGTRKAAGGYEEVTLEPYGVFVGAVKKK